MKSNKIKVDVSGNVNVGTIGFIPKSFLKQLTDAHLKIKDGAKDGKHPKPFYKTDRY